MFHGGTLVLRTSQCQRSWHKRVRLLSLPPSASAAVKVWHRSVKPGLSGASGFDPHRLHQWSHDLVAMMSACRAECESSILSGTVTISY